ncbi:MAG: hypothetical protein ACSW8E_00855 [Clostridia bacterium]
MDDLEGQIRQVLDDPAQMAQIMGLAQSLMGGGGEAPKEKPAPDSGLLGKLGSLLQQPGGDGDRQALLQAMRPFLSEKRQRKLDRAMHLTRMAHLARRAMDSLGGSEHA